MSAADFGFSDTVKVDHTFTFNIGDKWERPLRKAADSLVNMSYHWAESFRIVCYGLSTYFILSGLAKLVAATKATDDSPSSKARSSQHSSSSRSKTASSKDKSGDKSSGKSSKSTSEKADDSNREVQSL